MSFRHVWIGSDLLACADCRTAAEAIRKKMVCFRFPAGWIFTEIHPVGDCVFFRFYFSDLNSEYLRLEIVTNMIYQGNEIQYQYKTCVLTQFESLNCTFYAINSLNSSFV